MRVRVLNRALFAALLLAGPARPGAENAPTEKTSAPIAKISAYKTAGREPLPLAFSSAGSVDPAGGPLEFEWRLHPGDNLLAKTPDANFTIETPGNYVVELRAIDRKGGIGHAGLPVTVGNSPPEVRFIEPQTGDFFTPGKPLPYRVSILDLEDGDSERFDELFDARTFVSARWGNENLEPGLALMKRNGCFNCHAAEQKLTGPPLVEIADRYRAQPESIEASVQRVIKGSAGQWGEVPMLQHETIAPDDVRTMVRYIYGLQPGQSGAQRAGGLAGKIVPPADNGRGEALLEATYTDRGRVPAAPLTGTFSVRLRPRKMEAELADEKNGLKALGDFLSAISHGDYARFAAVNLGDSSSVTFRVASGGAGGRIELRAGSLTGDLHAQAQVEPTGGWDQWIEITSPFQPHPGRRRDLYIVFVNPGRSSLMNLDWLRFNEK